MCVCVRACVRVGFKANTMKGNILMPHKLSGPFSKIMGIQLKKKRVFSNLYITSISSRCVCINTRDHHGQGATSSTFTNVPTLGYICSTTFRSYAQIFAKSNNNNYPSLP